MPSSDEKLPPKFAHPSEEEFAQLLDYYQINWEYEPRTFILSEDENGGPLEAFSPDFYLVDFGMFIELTTAKSKLIGYKRRKIRLLQERYPDVTIKLLTRNDFIAMLDKYDLADHQGTLVGKEALNDE